VNSTEAGVLPLPQPPLHGRELVDQVGQLRHYGEATDGRPFTRTIVDRIFDTCLARGVRPFVQIGFMPKALSTRPEPYQHEWRPGLPYDTIITGWAWPPKDYDKWRELARQWVLHCVERYGRAEVEQWYWEVWNEPNGSYWKGTPEEFYKLHDYAVDGVRRALPSARVGGPHWREWRQISWTDLWKI